MDLWIQIDEEKVKERGLAYVRERIAHYKAGVKSKIEAKYRKAADEMSREGECEVDDGAVVSIGSDSGAYVMAWMWVTDEEAGITEKQAKRIHAEVDKEPATQWTN
jgi:hypothetical protein